MRIRIYLKGEKDADLIVLAKHPVFNLSVVWGNAVRAYASGEKFDIDLPSDVYAYNTVDDEKVVVNIMISDDDTNTISWIYNIKTRCRTTVFKRIVRNYFSTPCLVGLLNGNAEMVLSSKTQGAIDRIAPKSQSRRAINATPKATQGAIDRIVPKTQNDGRAVNAIPNVTEGYEGSQGNSTKKLNEDARRSNSTKKLDQKTDGKTSAPTITNEPQQTVKETETVSQSNDFDIFSGDFVENY